MTAATTEKQAPGSRRNEKVGNVVSIKMQKTKREEERKEGSR